MCLKFISKRLPHVKVCKGILDSGFHAMHFGFQVLNFLFFVSEAWISDSNLQWIPDSLSCITDFKAQDFGFRKQKFPVFHFANDFESRKLITLRETVRAGSQGNFRQTILTREGTVATALFSSRSCSIKALRGQRNTQHNVNLKDKLHATMGACPAHVLKKKIS